MVVNLTARFGLVWWWYWCSIFALHKCRCCSGAGSDFSFCASVWPFTCHGLHRHLLIDGLLICTFLPWFITLLHWFSLLYACVISLASSCFHFQFASVIPEARPLSLLLSCSLPLLSPSLHSFHMVDQALKFTCISFSHFPSRESYLAGLTARSSGK